MSYQSTNEYMPADPGYDQGYDDQAGAEGGEQSNVMMRRAVNIARNRLGWTITFALVIGAAGVVLGLVFYAPRYEAAATFTIQPTLPQVVGPSDENQPPAYFTGYLQEQIKVLMGPTNRARATETEQWNQLQQELNRDVMFPSDVDARLTRDGYTVSVVVRDSNKKVSAAAANALVRAYREHFSQQNSREDSQMFRRRKEVQRRKEQQLDDLAQRKAALAGGTSASQLEIAYQNQRTEMQQIRSRLNQVQGYLTSASSQGKDGDPMKLSPEQIAQRDEQMKQLLDQRRQAQQALQIRRGNGFGKSHPAVKSQRRLVEVLQDQIDQRAKQYRQGSIAPPVADGGEGGGETGLSRVQSRADQLAEQYETLEQEVADKAKKLADIGDLTLQQEQIRADLAKVQNKLEAMRVEENAPGGRIAMLNSAIVPQTPNNAKDQYVFPAGGGLLGMAVGVGIVVLMGLYDHRLQRFADAETDLGQVRILGGLPTLPEDLTDPEQAERTSMAIHHIRTLLQIGRRDRSQTYSVASGSPQDSDSPIIYVGGVPRVYSLTSASPGAGKSSLALALGLSYVTGDSRTLLIDADIIGGGLTRRVFGDENRPQRGMLDGGSSSTRLGELVVRPEGLQGLDFLPIGGARPEDAGVISLRMVRRIIAQARESYDVVLVDTGPVMGSTEASMFATESDGVIFVLARGDERKTVVRGMDHIRQVGGVLAGVVFNHALTDDLAKSSYGSMMSASRSIPPAQLNGDREQYARFGPISSAVASYGPLVHAAGRG